MKNTQNNTQKNVQEVETRVHEFRTRVVQGATQVPCKIEVVFDVPGALGLWPLIQRGLVVAIQAMWKAHALGAGKDTKEQTEVLRRLGSRTSVIRMSAWELDVKQSVVDPLEVLRASARQLGVPWEMFAQRYKEAVKIATAGGDPTESVKKTTAALFAGSK